VLLRLINKWDRYGESTDLFQRECLANITMHTVRKFFTLAKFYMDPANARSLTVMQEWLLNGDGSRFARGHLEFQELRELHDSDRASVLLTYSKSPHTYVYLFCNC
jgi:hypothetical protein